MVDARLARLLCSLSARLVASTLSCQGRCALLPGSINPSWAWSGRVPFEVPAERAAQAPSCSGRVDGILSQQVLRSNYCDKTRVSAANAEDPPQRDGSGERHLGQLPSQSPGHTVQVPPAGKHLELVPRRLACPVGLGRSDATSLRDASLAPTATWTVSIAFSWEGLSDCMKSL